MAHHTTKQGNKTELPFQGVENTEVSQPTTQLHPSWQPTETLNSLQRARDCDVT